jgi:hypothetical protein
VRAGRCSIIINNHAFKPSGVKGDTECLGQYQPSPLCPVRTVPYGIYLTNGRCDAMRWVLCLSDGQIVDALQASGLEGSVIFTTAQLTVPGRPHVQALLPSATCSPSWQGGVVPTRRVSARGSGARLLLAFDSFLPHQETGAEGYAGQPQNLWRYSLTLN